MNTTEALLELTTDPFMDQTIKQMGMQTRIESTDNTLNIHLHAGFPCQPLNNSLLPAIDASLQTAHPGKTVSTHLDFFIRAHKTQLSGKGLRGVKNTIAIASGKGGVGKSTVTVNLATALARAGARVGILDADIYGPSIPLMMGAHEAVQLKDDRYIPVMVHGVQAMSIGYLTDPDQALIWRGPMLAKSLLQMLDITLWDDLDYLFIDLPPGTGDIQLSLVQKIPLTAAVVVTTPQNVATLDAQKAIKMFERTGIDVLGVVENMSSHICSQCGHEETLFGTGGGQALSDAFKVPLLGQLPLDSRIRSQCDSGTPTAVLAEPDLGGHFMKTALRLAIALSKKPLNYANKFPPVVVE
ncbi:iron-sulfur cluster carrier protein ApbC [Legionella sp. CNM-4043-24]|uniref:iron-sulfur cluster carrier protein ApbC n=1 Tax=Legionella sp. CNM-4043-24 TaxID=3421646 RepID=UPI00403AB022